MGHNSTRAALIYLHGSDARQREIAASLGKLAGKELKGRRRSPRKAPHGEAAGTARLAGFVRNGAGSRAIGSDPGIRWVGLRGLEPLTSSLFSSDQGADRQPKGSVILGVNVRRVRLVCDGVAVTVVKHEKGTHPRPHLATRRESSSPSHPCSAAASGL
jgi:hypothetical protein